MRREPLLCIFLPHQTPFDQPLLVSYSAPNRCKHRRADAVEISYRRKELLFDALGSDLQMRTTTHNRVIVRR